ncbi:MAG: AI-2E family transporter [bacterium]
MDKQFSITITPGTMLMALVIAAGAYALWTLKGLVLLLITAVVLASAIRPGVHFFMRYRFPRVLAVLAMYLIVFGAVFIVLFFFFPPILDEAGGFFSSVPHYLESVNLPASLTDQGGGGNVLGELLALRDGLAAGSQGAINLLAAFFGGAFSLFLVIVLSFYFSVQESGVEDFIRLITPVSKEQYVVGLWRRSQQKIGLWMQGQLLMSLLAGILVYLGLLILGVPYALLLGIFTAMCEIIPVFGSFIAAVPAIVVAWTFGGTPLAFIVAGLFVVVNQFEANLIYPLVVKKIIGVPPLLVIVALIAGGELAGFLGVFLSVPLAAILQEFVSDIDKARRERARLAA